MLPRPLLFLGVLLLLPAGVSAGERIAARRIRAHVKFLAGDLLEGRAPGTRGGRLATEYIATQFALAGAGPAGDDGTYFQRVPLAGVRTEPGVKLTAKGNGSTAEFTWFDEFVGATGRQSPEVAFRGEVVFAGHGITAPEFGWDDYAGADVTGKVVIAFTNEPPSTDAAFFGGKALTYYGRWSYKYEEALRRGAAAVLLIHTDETAGYGWSVVQSSWGRERIQPPLAADQRALAFAGWLSREAGEKLLSLGGRTVDELLAAANAKGFRAVPLGVRIEGIIPSAARRIKTRNVVARVEGSDPKLRDQAVLYSAHWDHLGIGAPVAGDRIYNGAIDNATGVAVLLEIARAWAALEKRPRRSALFVAVTAEESGLLGSRYYAAHPVVPPALTAAALNLDSFAPLGLPVAVSLNGAERTTLMPQARDAARRFGLQLLPPRRTGSGSYFRSDHFAFARVGIPACSISMAGGYAGKSEEWIKQMRARNGYHQPSDEFRKGWDFSGLALIGEYGFLFGRMIADLDSLPTWLPGDPYRKLRAQQ